MNGCRECVGTATACSDASVPAATSQLANLMALPDCGGYVAERSGRQTAGRLRAAGVTNLS
jgi:hypothetical protein